MDPRVQVLKRTRDIATTIFRAGFVALIGVLLAYAYLRWGAMVPNSAAVLGGLLMLIVPVACFAIGFGMFASAVSALRAHGVRSPGIMRRREREPQLPDDDIWQHFDSQFRDN